MGTLCDMLCQLPLVEKATLEQKKDAEGLLLTIQTKAVLSSRETANLESLLSDALTKEGLTLETPALAQTYVTSPAPKQGRTVPLMAAVGAMITAVIIAVLSTFAIMTMIANRRADMTVTEGTGTQEENPYAVLNQLDKLFAQNSLFEHDENAIVEAVLDAYVIATGDKYAEYFNKEEYDALMDEQRGQMCGIGVQVINGHITIGEDSLQAIIVAYVYQNSPAEAAGVHPGDAIIYVGKGDDRQAVNSIGYTRALDVMAGEEGTFCEFAVYRASEEKEIDFSIQRQKLTVMSVTYSVCTTDATVGIIRMIQFDETTAPQLTAAIDALTAQGCTSFVFDLRGNPGGLLTSVVDVLTFFLNEGDVVLTAKDKYGRVVTYKVGSPTSKGYVGSGSGTIKAEEIGKYRDLNFTVMVNEYSASAAELFTANVRDYELGKIVGVTTYGKGSMQTTFPLNSFGYEGALKLTTYYYYPPCGEGYDSIGITPHNIVELSEEAQNININILPHNKDNQLQEAIRLLKQ